MELDRLAEASPMPRRRVAFADLSNSAERAATRKKPVARMQAAPSPSIPLPSPSSAASSDYPPWTRCFDPRYKYHYWYNHATGVSTWTEPNEAWVDEHPPAAAEDGDFWASWFDGDADEAIRQEAAARTAEAARSEKLRNEVRDRIVRSAAAPDAVAAASPVAVPPEVEAPPAVASLSPAVVAPPAAPAAVAAAPLAAFDQPIVATPSPAKVATSNGDLTARDALLGILAALLAANLYFAIYDKRRSVETAPPPVEVILSNATELVIPVSAEAPAAARAGGVLTIVLAPLRAFLGGLARLLVPRFPIV